MKELFLLLTNIMILGLFVQLLGAQIGSVGRNWSQSWEQVWALHYCSRLAALEANFEASLVHLRERQPWQELDFSMMADAQAEHLAAYTQRPCEAMQAPFEIYLEHNEDLDEDYPNYFWRRSS